MWCVVGILGNSISILILHKDRERREALFLLQMLAVADLFYLLTALMRYPLKYLLPQHHIYVEMQVAILNLDARGEVKMGHDTCMHEWRILPDHKYILKGISEGPRNRIWTPD